MVGLSLGEQADGLREALWVAKVAAEKIQQNIRLEPESPTGVNQKAFFLAFEKMRAIWAYHGSITQYAVRLGSYFRKAQRVLPSILHEEIDIVNPVRYFLIFDFQILIHIHFGSRA